MPGEKKTDNNKSTYNVLFQYGPVARGRRRPSLPCATA